VTVAKVNKVAEWKQRLSPLAYNVTREEAPSGRFHNPATTGTSRGCTVACVATMHCSMPTQIRFAHRLAKFLATIAAENVHNIADNLFGMTRTEVKCTLCDAHLGHVFDDGPKPTGLRYCMNTVALRFVPGKI